MILSGSDLRAVQTALDARLEIAMDRSLGGRHIRVSTRRASPAWYPAAMLVRLERWRGNLYSTQYFTSLEDVRRAL